MKWLVILLAMSAVGDDVELFEFDPLQLTPNKQAAIETLKRAQESYNKGDVQSARADSKWAAGTFYKIDGKSEEFAKALAMWGHCELDMHDPEKSLRLHLAAQDVDRSIGCFGPQERVRIASDIAIACRRTKDYQNSERYYDWLISVGKPFLSRDELVVTLANRCNLFLEMGKREAAAKEIDSAEKASNGIDLGRNAKIALFRAHANLAKAERDAEGTLTFRRKAYESAAGSYENGSLVRSEVAIELAESLVTSGMPGEALNVLLSLELPMKQLLGNDHPLACRVAQQISQLQEMQKSKP